MNLREMKRYAISLVRDQQMIDAHFVRWINFAYREFARQLIVPRLNSGDQIDLTIVPGSTNKYFLPYDYSKTIAFCDGTGRSLDPIKSEDVRQFGEYNTFGAFVQFFEQSQANFTPLADSGVTPITIGIPNRSRTVTASASIFTVDMIGEWLLPTARNTAAAASNPEDYAYLISGFTSDTIVTIQRPFRGVLSDAGNTGDLTTGYFEVRPNNTPIIRIWGAPSSDAPATVIKIEYQRVPSKLANDEDIPEEPRLSEAIVHKAIEKAGLAYRQGFVVQTGMKIVQESVAAFQTVEQFDKLLIHNFLTSNPMVRGYSQIGGRHISSSMMDRDSSGIRY